MGKGWDKVGSHPVIAWDWEIPSETGPPTGFPRLRTRLAFSHLWPCQGLSGLPPLEHIRRRPGFCPRMGVASIPPKVSRVVHFKATLPLPGPRSPQLGVGEAEDGVHLAKMAEPGLGSEGVRSPSLPAGIHTRSSHEDWAQSLLPPPPSLLPPALRRRLAPKLFCHPDTLGWKPEGICAGGWGGGGEWFGAKVKGTGSVII